MLGIRVYVEVFSAAFKRMAVINHGRKRPEDKAGTVEAEAAAAPQARSLPEAVLSEPDPVSIPAPEPAVLRRRIDPEKAAELEAILEKARKPKRARKAQVDENQLNLFDFVA